MRRAVALLAVAGAASAAVKTARPYRHKPTYVANFMERMRGVEYNHDFVGATADPAVFDVPKGWRPNVRRVKLGEGEACYRAAVADMRAWRMLDGVGWASVYLDGGGRGDASLEGVQAATQARCYRVAWFLNPVRVVYDQRDSALPEAKGIYSAVAFSTQKGHLLQGEERFAVEWHNAGNGPGEVLFRQ
mmetsp:Transcript_37777/g.118279  ORF Transcript_37777/g.118279 Transcript_37777/m.118279 type:complete len:189 (-) Transcript_37777:339-905(-)